MRVDRCHPDRHRVIDWPGCKSFHKSLQHRGAATQGEGKQAEQTEGLHAWVLSTLRVPLEIVHCGDSRAPDGSGRGATGAYELVVTFVPGYLENPGPDSFQSGIGVLSGWVCEAETVELVIDDTEHHVAAYGTDRADTQGDCGDTNNGFGLLFNWSRLSDGPHTVVALVDEVELGRATVRVATLGYEFLRGVEGECVVDDFPRLGQSVLLEWQQTSQNFVITEVE